jgi:hypothetical protein
LKAKKGGEGDATTESKRVSHPQPYQTRRRKPWSYHPHSFRAPAALAGKTKGGGKAAGERANRERLATKERKEEKKKQLPLTDFVFQLYCRKDCALCR